MLVVEATKEVTAGKGSGGRIYTAGSSGGREDEGIGEVGEPRTER